MNISSTQNFQNRALMPATVSTSSPQDNPSKVDDTFFQESEQAWDNYMQDLRELQDGSAKRGQLVGGATILALGAAGFGLGALTGTAGATAGAILGAGGGLTAGGLGGLYYGKDEGFNALGYMVVGATGLAALGGFAGHSFGSSAFPMVGMVAGGLAGIAAGAGLANKLEDHLEAKLKAKHGV